MLYKHLWQAASAYQGANSAQLLQNVDFTRMYLNWGMDLSNTLSKLDWLDEI